MINRQVEQGDGFKIYITILGENQAYLTASVTSPRRAVDQVAADVYQRLYEILRRFELQIVHERIFADLNFQQTILRARDRAFAALGARRDLPLTFIQGLPAYGEGLAGVQIRGFRPQQPGDGVWIIEHQGEKLGRKWRRNGAEFYMLQNIYGDPKSDRYHQSCRMFNRAQEVLQAQGLSFKNVLRTWIYLSHILDWYSEFNRARNTRFTEFGLLGQSEKENTEAEHIYLPASTGILGENPAGAAGTMDVFAVAPSAAAPSIAHTSGLQQKSPYRYGSAFSRAMTMKEKDLTHILLSGTASIDEHGKTVFQNDIVGQIRKTFEVVQALIRHEGASLQHINEATVFFKCAKDYQFYQQVAESFGVPDLPAIFIVADVCRDDLLFEIDAAIAF